MPDNRELTFTTLPDGSVNCTRTQVSIHRVDDAGNTILDRRAGNTILIAFKVAGLSDAKNERLVREYIAPLLVSLLSPGG